LVNRARRAGLDTGPWAVGEKIARVPREGRSARAYWLRRSPGPVVGPAYEHRTFEERRPGPSPEGRGQSQGGGLWTQVPPSVVATTSTRGSSSGGQAMGSRSSTTRSA